MAGHITAKNWVQGYESDPYCPTDYSNASDIEDNGDIQDPQMFGELAGVYLSISLVPIRLGALSIAHERLMDAEDEENECKRKADRALDRKPPEEREKEYTRKQRGRLLVTFRRLENEYKRFKEQSKEDRDANEEKRLKKCFEKLTSKVKQLPSLAKQHISKEDEKDAMFFEKYRRMQETYTRCKWNASRKYMCFQVEIKALYSNLLGLDMAWETWSTEPVFNIPSLSRVLGIKEIMSMISAAYIQDDVSNEHCESNVTPPLHEVLQCVCLWFGKPHLKKKIQAAREEGIRLVKQEKEFAHMYTCLHPEYN